MEIKDFCHGIQHIGLPTNDLEATISFYQSLGFTVAYRTVNGTEAVAFFQLGNLMFESYENRQAALSAGAIDHIAIDVTDIDNLYALVKERGYHILNSGVDALPFWEKGVKFFTIVGPNEEKIEFCERLK